MTRAVRRAAAVLVLLTGLVTFVSPSVASAHAVLLSSVPASSSVLPKSPERIELVFNEDVEANLSGIRLFDSAQKEIEVGPVRTGSGPATITADIPTLADGTYVVVWRVTSSDGHPVNGAFPFEIGTVSTGTGSALVDRVTAAVQHRSPLGGAMSVAKFVAFAGYVLLVGMMLFSWGTQLLGSARALAGVLGGILLMLLGSLGVLLLQGPYVTGGGWSDIASVPLVGDVLGTRVGLAIVARIVIAVLWLLLVQILRRDAWNSVTGTLVVLLAVFTVVTFSVSGHPAAETLPGVFVTVDVLHLAGVGVWIGGLVSMWLLRAEHGSNPQLAGAVVRHSRNSGWAMPLVVVTGAAQGLHLVGGPGALGETRYSWMLLGKAALVGLVILLGLRARRMLAVDQGVSGRFNRTVRVEAAVAVVVLALSAGLVTTSPRAADSPLESFSARLVQRNIIAEVTVTPPRVGTAEIHALFTPPGGSLSPVRSVKVRMTLQARDVPAIPVEMLQVGANHWSGVVQIPYAGNWSIEFLVAPQENTELRYSTTVPVKA